MKKLLDLYNLSNDQNINVYDYRMSGLGMDAISIKTPKATGIFIDYKQITTVAAEKYLLSHELGHCLTGAMHKFSSPLEVKSQNEYRADRWAAHKIIPFNELVEAVSNGVVEPWELAEHFNVPEEFIKKAYQIYCNEGLIA